MGQLNSMNCVITGAAGSIGLASAKLFVEEGANVSLVDRDGDGLRHAAAALQTYRDRLDFVNSDVCDAEGTRRYIDRAADTWGGIDVMFINAGISGECRPTIDYREDIFDSVLAANVRSVFLACKYGIPRMVDGGSIIITSSIMGIRANPNIVAYATSKHAVVGLMKVVALEVAPRKIRVNILAPGPVNNDFQTNIERELSDAMGLDATEMIDGMIPLRRHAGADEIARSALFLASAASSFTTGSVLMVDGGLSI